MSTEKRIGLKYKYLANSLSSIITESRQQKRKGDHGALGAIISNNRFHPRPKTRQSPKIGQNRANFRA
jgi:hypothetical protein